jgi:hypothetical protein
MRSLWSRAMAMVSISDHGLCRWLPVSGNCSTGDDQLIVGLAFACAVNRPSINPKTAVIRRLTLTSSN